MIDFKKLRERNKGRDEAKAYVELMDETFGAAIMHGKSDEHEHFRYGFWEALKKVAEDRVEELSPEDVEKIELLVMTDQEYLRFDASEVGYGSYSNNPWRSVFGGYLAKAFQSSKLLVRYCSRPEVQRRMNGGYSHDAFTETSYDDTSTEET